MCVCVWKRGNVFLYGFVRRKAPSNRPDKDKVAEKILHKKFCEVMNGNVLKNCTAKAFFFLFSVGLHDTAN